MEFIISINNSEYEEMQVKHNKMFYGVIGQINDNMFRPFFTKLGHHQVKT